MRLRSLVLISSTLLLAGSCGTGPGGSPVPSVLAVDSISSAFADLIWSQCPDDDFDSYRLYRSESPDIRSDTTGAERVYTGTAVGSTVYSDYEVEEDSTYYYALTTQDTEGLTSWSNELEVHIPQLGLPEGMEFATIPSGSFEMGAPAGEVGSDPDEIPVHTVTFDYSFEMMTTEVTQSIWHDVMGDYPSWFNGSDFPVESVSWEDCQDFVEAMNSRYPGYEFRLPTEAEWEYCCRAGTTTRFYWGDDPDYSQIGEYEWYWENSGSTTHAVGQKVANDWGLYDMCGNVFEWCEDWYHSDYTGAPSDGSPWLTPEGSYRVTRGGCWYFDPQFCRSAGRFSFDPAGYDDCLGLRLVRSAR
jgi:formylglycine-generating enzyme required for sulfatase activity